MTSINYTNTVLNDNKLTKSLLDVATNDGTFVIWLQAFTSVIIISVCGLIPIVCMPRLQRSKYQNDLLQFLIGLAIGTLTADALLHLLPISGQARHSHASGHRYKSHNQSSVESSVSEPLSNQKSSSTNDDHHEDNYGHRHDHNETIYSHDEGFWFGFMALVGIIGFLIMERLMVLLTDACTHREHRLANVEAKNGPGELKDLPATDPHLHHQHSHQNHHQHQHHHLTNKTKSFMFMIITGDGLHNFFDGIAIGVSYGSSLTVGISTSIAILCHELPHEIGDFAVLIKSGATTGVFIGKIDVGWVSALIAGMFLYISLVDMMPQLDCYPTKPVFKRAVKLLIQLSGIGMGVLIMSLIALYESKLFSLISTYSKH